MVMLDNEWEQFKRDVTHLQRLKDRDDGRYAELFRRLKRDFGIKTLAEAIKAVKEAGERERKDARIWAKKMKVFAAKLERAKKLMGVK